MRSQITSDTTRKLHICKKCFTHFTKQDLFEKHLSYCSKNETIAVKMPTKTPFSNFKIISKNFQFLLPYMLILNVSLYQLTLVNQIQTNLIPKVIKNTSQVVTVFILKVWME